MTGIIKRPDGAGLPASAGGAVTPMAQKLGALSKGRIGSRLPVVGERGELYAAFAFDTTGSMYDWFEEGTRAIGRIAAEVWQRQKEFRFAYIPYKNHGDEDCFDGHHPFATTEFTAELRRMEQQLAAVNNGGGGDGLCAMEDVFHFLNTDAQWPKLAKKTLVVIGDMPPHGVLDGIGKCPHEYNYRAEVARLKDQKVPVYTVYCHDEQELASARKQKIKDFYHWLAAETGGKCLELADIDELVQVLIGVCMKETGHLQDYLKQLGRQGRLNGKTEKNLLLLGGGR